MSTESANKTALQWIAGIASALVVAGLIANISFLFGIRADIAVLQSSVSRYERTFEALNVRIDESSAKRYTADDASKDRASLLSLVQATIEHTNQQDLEIKKLLVFQAHVEERMQLGTK